MKIKPFLFIAFVLFLISCGNKNENEAASQLKGEPNIELSGTLINSSGETLLLYYNPTNVPQLIDSAKIDENGNFSFKNTHIDHVGFYTLKINEQIFCPLILEPKQKIQVTGDAKNLGNDHKISGSKDNEIFKEINRKIIRFRKSVDSIGAEFQSKMDPKSINKSDFNALSSKYEAIYNTFTEKFYAEMISLMNSNPNSFASLAAAVQLDLSKNSAACLTLYTNLSKIYPNNPTLISFNEYTRKFNALSKGSVAPEISLLNPDGKNFSLSSLKGKFVLIDFWASWCKPCIKDMPEVKKMYAKYKSKNFEILGVSLDENKDAWIRAISQNELPWLHVSDLGGWNSSAARTYEVNSIPYTVLIDDQGKIVEKGLRGKALEERLNQIFR